MGYTILHGDGTVCKSEHFTPTGPVFTAFPANRLPF